MGASGFGGAACAACAAGALDGSGTGPEHDTVGGHSTWSVEPWANRGQRTRPKSGSAKSIQRAAVRMKFTFVFYVEIDSRLCSTTRRTDSASERNVSESALRSYLQMYLYLPCTVDAINEKTFALDEIVL